MERFLCEVALSVPLSLFAFGLVVSSVLGFVAGWVLAAGRSGQAEPVATEAKASPAGGVGEESDRLTTAWNGSAQPRVVMHLRMDAIETWRRTHGQKTVEHFLSEIIAVVTDELAPGGGMVRKGDEAIAVTTGDVRTAAQIAETLRAFKFAHINGGEALVSAGMGVVEETDKPLQVQLQRAFAAASECGRHRHAGFTVWTPSGVRHVRPVEVLT